MDALYWNKLASNYSSNVLELVHEDRNKILLKYINKLSSKDLTAIDFGCGPGSLLSVLSKRFKKVFAVDFAENLLSLAQHNTRSDNVDYIHADLSKPKILTFKADRAFCVNALINPDPAVRETMLNNIAGCLKRRGLGVFVVPSYESILHVYQCLVRCGVSDGRKYSSVLKKFERQFANEIISAISGTVDIGGEPTKCYTQDDLNMTLTGAGFRVECIERVEYNWVEEIDHPPHWLKEPYPYDWLAKVVKK